MIKSLCTTAAAAAALLALSGAAQSASLISGRKIEVNVDPKKVPEETAALWSKYGGWCAISEWHPAVAKCEESTEGADTFRTLTLKDGGVIKEKLLEKADASYKYAIVSSPLPVKNYEAKFAIIPDDDDLDEVNISWAATYDAEGKPDKEARAVIDGIFKDGLENIRANLPKEAKEDGGEKDGDDK
jgi:hypothetical protein